MPGRRRKIGLEKYRAKEFTPEDIHNLLVKELGASLVPDSDKTVPQEWAPPKLTQREMEEMGLFDQYAEAGVDLGNIELLPFRYDDGIYVMALAGFDFQQAKKAEWGNQIELRWMFVGDANGDKNKYTGKSHVNWLSLPLASNLKSDDSDIAKRANGALSKTFQTLFAMGIADPKSMELKDMVKLKGVKYIVALNTPQENNEKGTQYTNVYKPFNPNAQATQDSTADLWDDEPASE
jgi:hypothetical protein